MFNFVVAYADVRGNEQADRLVSVALEGSRLAMDRTDIFWMLLQKMDENKIQVTP